MPVLVLLIFGSIEFGLAVQARTMIGNAAREGVRVASLTANGDTTSQAQVETAVKNALGGVSGGGTPTIVYKCATPAGVACVVGAKGNGNNVATVTVTIHYTGITGMFPSLTNTTLSASSYMRIEG